MSLDKDAGLFKSDLATVEHTVDSRPAVVRDRWVCAICALHLTAGWIAMLLAWYDVETIVGTFPALIVMGVMVIVPAMRRSSWWLLGYGLSAFWAVAFVSLVIAIFDLSPSEAVHIVPLILTVYAIFQGLWCIRCNCALLEKPATNIANLPRLQFSIRAMLLLTTVVCVLSAVGRSIPWKNEMWVFGSGGLALLGVSAVIMFWFTVRIKNIRQAT